MSILETLGVEAIKALAVKVTDFAASRLPDLLAKHGGDAVAALRDLADTYEAQRTEQMPDISADVAGDRAEVDRLLDEKRKAET